jgi:hypothetical protein
MQYESTIRTLSNGKRVANFSSPHPFEFEDGTIVPAVPAALSEHLKILFIEEDMGNGDVKLSFKLTPQVQSEMRDWIALKEKGEVDVVFCPLPMIQAIKDYSGEHYLINLTPFRAVRIEDRIKKLVSIHKQSV